MSNPSVERIYGARARIALMVPSPNTVAETEFWRAVPPQVSVHTARMPFFGDRFEQPFVEMEKEVPRVFDEVRSAAPDVIAYGCTASSAKPDAIGYERQLSERAGIKTVTAAAALLRALSQFNATRIALVTPYPQATNDKEREFFRQHGIEVIADESVIVHPEQARFRNMFSVPGSLLAERAIALGAAHTVQAVVLSCCDMPTFDVLGPIEQALRKPVVSSTQSLLWSALREFGIPDAIAGAGRLLSTSVTASSDP